MINPKDVDLRSFLERWHGPTEENLKPLPDDCGWLPKPLRDWHELTSQWFTPITRMNRMIPPEAIHTENGFAVFLENQGVQEWAFKADDPSTVYKGEDVYEMERVSEELDVFVIHSALYEVAHGSPSWRRCDAAPEEQLNQVLDPMTRVSFDDSLTSIHLSDRLIAAVTPHMSGRPEWGAIPNHWNVQVAAINAGDLEYLHQITDLVWHKSPW